MALDLPLPVPPPTLFDALSRKGPILDALTHQALKLGQRVPADITLEDEGAPSQAGGASGRRGAKKATAGQKPAVNKPGSVALLDLIQAGLVEPGSGNLSVSYKGVHYTASLLPDGTIEYEGQLFQTASALSIYCKRLQTPHKQGDDGWKSVHYQDKPLDHFRKQLHESVPSSHPTPKAAGGAGRGGPSPLAKGGRREAATPAAEEAAKGEGEGEEEAGEGKAGDAATGGRRKGRGGRGEGVPVKEEAAAAAAAGEEEELAAEGAGAEHDEQPSRPSRRAQAKSKLHREPAVGGKPGGARGGGEGTPALAAAAAAATPPDRRETQGSSSRAAAKQAKRRRVEQAQQSRAPPSTGGAAGRKQRGKGGGGAAEQGAAGTAGSAPLMIKGQLVVELPQGGEGSSLGLKPSDQWVQCDRCSTWRLVPNKWWRAVQEDEREEWYCEYAQWDVRKMLPNQPPCTP